MYDAKSFSELLRDLDYQNVRLVDFGESRMPILGCLDIPSRRKDSFYVEAETPT